MNTVFEASTLPVSSDFSHCAELARLPAVTLAEQNRSPLGLILAAPPRMLG